MTRPITLASLPANARMVHWQETQSILRQVCATDAGGAAALALLVAVEGSSFRRPGAKLLFLADGRRKGSIGGGCLDADIATHAQEVRRTGRPRLISYDTSDTDVTGLELGCGGRVTIVVTPVGSEQDRILAAEALSAMAARERVRLVYRHPDEDAAFIELLTPPPQLVLCGAGVDGDPLAAFAAEAGFRVTVFDQRQPPPHSVPSDPRIERLVRGPEDGFSGLRVGDDLFVVVRTHSLALDREWLRQAAVSGARYVGVLGARRRTASLLRELEETACESGAEVHAPVGLDIGAEGAAQIAVSITAELLAVHAGRTAGHLRERRASAPR